MCNGFVAQQKQQNKQRFHSLAEQSALFYEKLQQQQKNTKR